MKGRGRRREGRREVEQGIVGGEVVPMIKASNVVEKGVLKKVVTIAGDCGLVGTPGVEEI